MAMSKTVLSTAKETFKTYQRKNTTLVMHRKVQVEGIAYKPWVRDVIEAYNLYFC